MQDLVKEGGCECCCRAACLPDSQHPGKAGKGGSAPHALPGVFAASCLASALFFARGATASHSLSLHTMGLPDAGPPLSCLSSTAKPSHCCPELAPHSLELAQQHTSIPPVLFEAL